MSDISAPDGVVPTLHEQGEVLRFSTTLKPKAFLGLSLKNGLLNLITLTLYRFWGKTEVRRRVWQGVRLNGDAFEYTGRGVELFVGFLLALLVLGLPFLLLVFGAQFMGPGWAAAILLPFYIFLYWLWGFGVFTAFRYMASRSTWRGVRFRLGGSAKSYGLAFLGYILLTGVTMGWYGPMAERRLAERIWGDLRFGDRRFAFRSVRSEKVGVYGAFAIGWFGTGVVYSLTIAMAMTVVMATGMHQNPDDTAASFAFMATLYGVMAVGAPLFLLVWAPYRAAILRSIAAGVTLDKATFRLEVKALPLFWLTLSNLFMVLITLGFLMPWAQARATRFMVERLRAEGVADLETARQAGKGPGSGEGLADAFGFSLI